MKNWLHCRFNRSCFCELYRDIPHTKLPLLISSPTDHLCICTSVILYNGSDWQVKIWDYGSQQLLHSIDTGHSANIFCTKFMPETGDDVVVSGAGDAEVCWNLL